MSTGSRPLSPHLQIYKPQITSVLSIFHRFTGIVLAVGTLAIAWWLIAAAAGPDAFADAQTAAGSWLGRLFLFGWTLALFYHLANGIRHLFWDMGKGFDLPTVYASGWVVIAAAVVLTLACWILAYATMGGA